MKLYEYQAKELMESSGIKVPTGVFLSDKKEIDSLTKNLTFPVMVKAQIHAGGRGKVGAIKKADNRDEMIFYCNELFGKEIKTKQTGSTSLIVNSLLIEECMAFVSELYISIITDRAAMLPVLIISKDGGMEIEETAENSPEKIKKITLDTQEAITPDSWNEVIEFLDECKINRDSLITFLDALYKVYWDNDTTMIEINPLVVTDSGEVLALDAKMVLDDNADFRHKERVVWRDGQEENIDEIEAAKYGLNYIKIEDGNVGCMVNGAGLAMATMDSISQFGGRPANFLDVGGNATAENVNIAFKILARDKDVKSILINIFGGIMKCDLIASGIIEALKTVQMDLPLVVRLEGTNVEKGRNLIEESGINCEYASTLSDAARLAVELTKGK